MKDINILHKKISNSYSDPIKKAIRLVTFDLDTLPVGSFSYKSQRYPGDIDIRESIKACCNRKVAIERLTNRLQELAFRLSQESGYYFADFKAGIDHIFYIPVDKNIYFKINKLFNNGFLTNKEYNQMIKVINNNDLEELKELIRNKYTIRWTLNDLLNGYKILPGNRQINLSDALQHKTIVKLDIWAPINGRYIEVSNFLSLIEIDKNGNQTLINGKQPDYIKSIKSDVKSFFSENNLNAFKATKRLWLLAATFKDQKMLEKINKLISSDAGIMYQVASDIKTLIDIFNTLNTPPYDYLFKEIDDFRNRLSFVYNIPFDEKYIDDLIINITNGLHLNKDIVNVLTDILDHLMVRLNKYTLDYDIQNNIYPVKGKYL